MKKILGIIVLGLLWCNVGFAEIYACSVDLTRYGRPGEIETKMYVREGNFFYNNRNWKFDIYKEDKKEIYLIEKIADSLFIVIINKETKVISSSTTLSFTYNFCWYQSNYYDGVSYGDHCLNDWC